MSSPKNGEAKRPEEDDLGGEWTGERYEAMGAPITRKAVEFIRAAVPELDARVARASALADVACGTGSASTYLADQMSPSASLVAEDIAEDYLAVLRKKLSAHPAKARITVRVGDALTLSGFADKSIDVLLSVAGLPWVFEEREKRVAGLKQARRVLKPDGIFVCTTWIMPGFSPEDLPLSTDKTARDEFTEAGWFVNEASDKAPVEPLKITQRDMPGDNAHFSHVRIFSVSPSAKA